MRYLELNGESFEVHKSKCHNVAPIMGCNHDEIFEVYGRPSIYKVGIWESWCKWCDDINNTTDAKCGIEIASHNCNFFTIHGSYRFADVVYDLEITAYHNRLYYHDIII